ncbi:MAG: hypothetical protein FWG25_07930 [Promicromonosporaceae bacterium]|nr:hypothetical protein [Promicromonosporaceae bacterium]
MKGKYTRQGQVIAALVGLGLVAAGCGGEATSLESSNSYGGSDIGSETEVSIVEPDNSEIEPVPTPTVTVTVTATPEPIEGVSGWQAADAEEAPLCESPLPPAEIAALFDEENEANHIADGWALLALGDFCVDTWGDPGWQVYAKNQTGLPISSYTVWETWTHLDEPIVSWAVTETEDGWIQPGEIGLISLTVDLAGEEDLGDTRGVIEIYNSEAVGSFWYYFGIDHEKVELYPVGEFCWENDDGQCEPEAEA